MILTVTEVNAWERERWTYVFEPVSQGARALNHLMLFAEAANREAKVALAAAPRNTSYWGGNITPVAVSSYQVRFYDDYEINDRGQPILITLGVKYGRLTMNGEGGYHPSVQIMFGRRISPNRIKSAFVAMRDKHENKLYKDFESVLLARKRGATE